MDSFISSIYDEILPNTRQDFTPNYLYLFDFIEITILLQLFLFLLGFWEIFECNIWDGHFLAKFKSLLWKTNNFYNKILRDLDHDPMQNNPFFDLVLEENLSNVQSRPMQPLWVRIHLSFLKNFSCWSFPLAIFLVFGFLFPWFFPHFDAQIENWPKRKLQRNRQNEESQQLS